MAAELQQFLVDLNLERYFPPCLPAGIQNWEAFMDITESEFDALNMNLGVGSAVQASLRIRQISLTGPFHSPISYASTTQNQPKYPKYSI